MRPTLDTPLTDDEIDTLDAYLLESGLDAPMDISMLDGFLCAVLSGPAALPLSHWLPWVWDFHAGEQAPEFRDPKEGKYLLGLIMRFAHEIAHSLTYAPEDFEPLFPVRETEEGEIPVVDEWCFGYLKGTALSPEAWQPLMDARPEWFETIRLHGTEEGWKQLEELVENRPDADARHLAYVERIAPAVRLIHAHWLEARGPVEGLLPQDAQPIRNTARPGRNDPCPCGSGRKYKLCHGAAN